MFLREILKIKIVLRNNQNPNFNFKKNNNMFQRLRRQRKLLKDNWSRKD